MSYRLKAALITILVSYSSAYWAHGDDGNKRDLVSNSTLAAQLALTADEATRANATKILIERILNRGQPDTAEIAHAVLDVAHGDHSRGNCIQKFRGVIDVQRAASVLAAAGKKDPLTRIRLAHLRQVTNLKKECEFRPTDGEICVGLPDSSDVFLVLGLANAALQATRADPETQKILVDWFRKERGTYEDQRGLAFYSWLPAIVVTDETRAIAKQKFLATDETRIVSRMDRASMLIHFGLRDDAEIADHVLKELKDSANPLFWVKPEGLPRSAEIKAFLKEQILSTKGSRGMHPVGRIIRSLELQGDPEVQSWLVSRLETVRLEKNSHVLTRDSQIALDDLDLVSVTPETRELGKRLFETLRVLPHLSYAQKLSDHFRLH